MNMILIGVAVVVGVVALIVLVAVIMYNQFVRLKTRVDEAWSGINVQLKRRYDLVPNLVAIVKRYSVHEKSIFESIAQARAASVGAVSADDKMKADASLAGSLRQLFAVVENYPDLKADTQFLNLQHQLTDLESEIQLSRRYYNGSAREYNRSIAVFPAKIVAGVTGFEPVSYFEIGSAERENPRVSFDE